MALNKVTRGASTASGLMPELLWDSKVGSVTFGKIPLVPRFLSESNSFVPLDKILAGCGSVLSMLLLQGGNVFAGLDNLDM